MKAVRTAAAGLGVALALLPLGIGAALAVHAVRHGGDESVWPLVALWILYASVVAAFVFRFLRRSAVTEAAAALAQARRDDDARVLAQIPVPAAAPRLDLGDLDDPEAMRLLEYNDRLARLRDQR